MQQCVALSFNVCNTSIKSYHYCIICHKIFGISLVYTPNMSEMLANQYFLTRKYNLAAKEMEESIFPVDNNKLIIKKLIICYTQINKPSEALDLFLEIIKTDIDTIIKTDLNSDDCPCFELIERIKCDFVKYEDEFTKSYILGILFLYCNIKQSLDYFKAAGGIDASNKKIKNIIKILKNKINNYN